jgi:dimethylaniline monooxygenase (N-oxide forming)
MRLPPETAPHQTLPDYVEYLNKYSAEYKITGHIKFLTSVQRVKRREDGRYDVTSAPVATGKAEATKEEFDAVAVCSGLHNVPHIPDFAGMDSFPGEVLHSSEYKHKSVFHGKRVLVIGAGETAMDISYRAAQVADSTALAVRSGFLSVPTVFGKLPLDTLIANLFEHCYGTRNT